MTWTAAIMPDDALPPDSLVGRMLRPEPHYVSDEAFDALQSFIAEDTASPPPATVEHLPLWRVMATASLTHEMLRPGDPYRTSLAAEIEALRDWLLPEAPEPSAYDGQPRYEQRHTIWQRDNKLRAHLTEQARIAGDGRPH